MTPVRVAYDHQAFIRQRRGGVSRLFAELFREFRADPALGIHVELDFWLNRTDHLASQRPDGVRTIREGHPLDHRRLSAWANRSTGWARRRAEFDVFHPTYYAASAMRRRRSRPVACTLLDMIPERFPELTRSGAHEDKLEMLRRCDLVICISESVRNEMRVMLGDIDAIVRVCPLGTHPAERPEAFGSRNRTILFVGERRGYKRFTVLAEALALLELDEIELVCVGGGAFTGQETAWPSALAATGVHVRRIDATDAELGELYRTSAALVSTSLMEGFGLPVVEAMGTGCPVILADTAIYREIAGSAAGFFPVDDSEALAAQITRLFTDTAWSEDLGQQGWARSQTYTWRRTAELTADAYRAVTA